MNTRCLLETLGFQEDWQTISDSRPVYAYDFGNFRLTASQLLGRNYTFRPVFSFGGIMQDARSLRLVEFEIPLEVASFEQGVAWIAYGIGSEFQPRRRTPWLVEGRMWHHHLPWVRERKAHESRPKCLVEKDWFRVAMKKLRAVAATASEGDLAWLAFDGEALRVSVRKLTFIVPATGTAWDTRYAIRAMEVDHLPKGLTNLVEVSIWDARITIGNRVWKLADSHERTIEPV